jgi:hypothetical protein
LTPISIPLLFQIQPITIIIDKNIPVHIRQQKRTKQEKDATRRIGEDVVIFSGALLDTFVDLRLCVFL